MAEKITMGADGFLMVPDDPIIPFIEGDGTGVDIWPAARLVLDAAAAKYGHDIEWKEVLAGEKAYNETGDWLPQETVDSFMEHLIGIKGPLTTPIGGGFRSLNVALRQILDLYVCLRPVRWFRGVPSPVKHPELVDMVIFRENTEDIYAGIEFQHGDEDCEKFKKIFTEAFPERAKKIRFPDTAGIGIKPVSEEGTGRIVRAAIKYAIANKHDSVTLVHKGNIMKFTEGYFKKWGYEYAEAHFGDKVFTWNQYDKIKEAEGSEAANKAQSDALDSGKLLVKDGITDAFLQQILLRPSEYDVIATMNLNGDYISDAAAASVGGIGICLLYTSPSPRDRG